MYNSDTELLFPIRVIPSLGQMRGESWKSLVQKVSSQQAGINEQIAFVLMMVRMSGCITCNADSFRAMRGCTQCAFQTIRRFRGSDQELIEQFEQASREVESYLKTRAERSTQ